MVDLPLWKIWVRQLMSVGMMIPNWMEKCSKPPTRYIHYIHVRTTASWGSLFATKGFSERRLFKLGFHADLPLQKNLLLQEALGEGYWFWHMPGVDTLMSVFNNHRLVFSKTQISSWLRHIRHDVSQLNGSLGVYPTPFEEKPYDMGSVKSIYYKIFS